MDSQQVSDQGLQAPLQGNAVGAPVAQSYTAPDHNLQPSQDIGATHNNPEDNPALDEEWVNKAKAIVEQSKNDPFTLSKELNKVRAGYLKARYDKDLKIDEDKDQ
jgi:hypothetical protein